MTAVRDAWDAALDRAAAGLDFAEAEDRATFRQRVADVGSASRRHVLVEVLGCVAPTTQPRQGSASVLRQIADAYMARARADRDV